MASNEFKLADGAARIYEEKKVPAVFGPLAEVTIEKLPPHDGDRILDLACGTGIVARSLRRIATAETTITGADFDARMLAVAADVADSSHGPIEWQQADVMDLPFADGAFTKLYCQQGFQFFPDEELALREMRRVLAPGGHLVLTIWRGDSALFEAIAKVLGERFNQDMADKAMLPFRYAGRDSLAERMVLAGFSDVHREGLPIDRQVDDNPKSIEQEILGSPVGADLATVSADSLRETVARCHAALAQHRRGDKLILRQTTDVYLATALG